MKILLQKTILLSILIFTLNCKSKEENISFPKFAEYYSPKSKISLNIKNQKFELENLEFSSDQIFSTPITNGTIHIEGNKVILKGKNKKEYILRIETEEILKPEKFENVKNDEKFLAWTIYYDNGNEKQNGGWNDDNTKEGVWSYFDKTGKKTKKLYEKGKLIDENFK